MRKLRRRERKKKKIVGAKPEVRMPHTLFRDGKAFETIWTLPRKPMFGPWMPHYVLPK
jgi:hypothetical protein